jgi:hypothetical protein
MQVDDIESRGDDISSLASSSSSSFQGSVRVRATSWCAKRWSAMVAVRGLQENSDA